MSDMKMETRKGYLEGILDQITVTLNEDLTHRLAIRFKHPIVGDRHEWSNPRKKSDGYQIHDGTTDLEFSNTLTKHGGANLKKKSSMRELDEVHRTRWTTERHRGIVSNGWVQRLNITSVSQRHLPLQDSRIPHHVRRQNLWAS